MPKPYFGKQPLPEYKPSDAVRAAIKAWEESVALEEERRHAARRALADELKANPELPYAAVAAHPIVPWTEATLRIIGQEFDVPPRNPNKAWKRPRKEEQPAAGEKPAESA
ncbi:hypothetical protein ACFOOM_01110 [Streptomyces echinoruber]|uniref:Uncharacterized protein n=1 Tax=Streptomyces echinoruber TaxID=68898 RepID=A0A918QUY4_9ACTN|nr:hypothetical protein [Streptomyces echinoruber]GGZ73065.1 hypothetical protein GCM10010389_08120 [Streptomyces echinoruber]